MSDRLHEQLSALLDGELSAAEAELLLRRLDRDAVLRERLGRFALIGDVVRVSRLESAATVESVASAGFAARISAAIEAEEQQSAVVAAGQGVAVRAELASAATPRGRRRTVRRWWQPMGGIAVAAGVAGLAFVVLQRAPMTAAPGALVAATPLAVSGANGAGSPLPAGAIDVVAAAYTAPGTYAVAGEPVSYTTPERTGGPSPTFIPAAELASYVVAHSEVSGPLARHNVLSGVVVEPMTASGQESVSTAQQRGLAEAPRSAPATEPGRP